MRALEKWFCRMNLFIQLNSLLLFLQLLRKDVSTVSKHYFAGATRIATRKYSIPQTMTVEYYLGDHLGSTSITTDSSGAKVSELRYKPFGEIRYAWTSAPVTAREVSQVCYNSKRGVLW
jgi:hypothetical protein